MITICSYRVDGIQYTIAAQNLVAGMPKYDRCVRIASRSKILADCCQGCAKCTASTNSHRSLNYVLCLVLDDYDDDYDDDDDEPKLLRPCISVYMCVSTSLIEQVLYLGLICAIVNRESFNS